MVHSYLIASFAGVQGDIRSSHCDSFGLNVTASKKRADEASRNNTHNVWERVYLDAFAEIHYHRSSTARSTQTVLLFTSAIIFALSLLLNRFVREFSSIDRACTERFSPWDGFVTYPYDRISELNKSTDDDWWVHDGDLITLTEWAHQIHCTWLIRQWLYHDSFDYSPFTNISSTRFHMHKDHCFLVLKTIIECNTDATPVLFAKDESGLGAWRTVDPPKMCRRNEQLVDYVKENMVCDLECEPGDLE
ncbi:hypothetical protein BDV12DRAFT_190876 [Aspergillus spectabilis]